MADSAVHLSYTPGPTQLAFHNDASLIKVIGGPVGSGKSAACVMEGLLRVMRQPPGKDGVRRARFGIVRQTYPRLQTTTRATVKEWLPVELGDLKGNTPMSGFYTFRLPDGTSVALELLLMAVSTDGVAALKSLELSYAWVHEMTETGEDILDTLVERTGRFPAARSGAHCAEPGVFGDFNLPGKDHWVYRRFVAAARRDTPPLDAGTDPRAQVTRYSLSDTVVLPTGEETVVTQALFLQPPAVICTNQEQVETERARPVFELNPYAENIANHTDDYYARQLQGDMTPDRWRRVRSHLMMQWVAEARGKLVFSEFSRDDHVAIDPVAPVAGYPVLIGCDTSGLHPCAVFAQMHGASCVIKDVAYGDGMAFEQFITDMLLPLLAQTYPGCQPIVICDPSNPRDARTGTTPVQLLYQYGLAAVPAATNTFSLRRQAVSGLLSRRNGMIISPACVELIDAFESSYVFKELRGSRDVATLYAATPVKSDASHGMDAVQYLALYLTRKGMEESATGPQMTREDRRRKGRLV